VGGAPKEGKLGKIGKKGIGFKSVFMISQSPHIVSGNYAFKFDRCVRERAREREREREREIVCVYVFVWLHVRLCVRACV